MAIKKHKLTTQTDLVIGARGADLFLAPAIKGKATLSNKDVLDGKGGIDTINAFISANTLTPKLANIEIGVFTRKSTSDLTLDLAKATKMTQITLNSFDADVTIKNARVLSSFAATKSADDIFTLNDVDATKVALEKLKFDAVTNGTLAINTIGGSTLKAMDISLQSSSVTLKDKAIAATVTVHSNGTAANMLSFTNVNTTGLQVLTIDGKAALDLAKGNALAGLTTFDAAKMAGDLIANIGGTGLTLVNGGSGKDNLTITSLGGPTPTVNLGLGDDTLDMRLVTVDATKVTLIGGDGVDTLRLKGAATTLGTAAIGFEKLDLTDATGTYVLDDRFISLSFSGATNTDPAKGTTTIDGGVNLKSIAGGDGSDSFFTLKAIGGSVGDKAIVSLGGGADVITVFDLKLDSQTQFFDGGEGIDEFFAKGTIANLSSLTDNFEVLRLLAPTGAFDFAGTDFTKIHLYSTMGLLTLDGLADGTDLYLYGPIAGMAITTQSTPSASDTLNLHLGRSATASSQVSIGLPDVSKLNIACESAYTLFMSRIGSTTDHASITVSGTGLLTMSNSVNNENYVKTFTSTNTAGVDLLNFKGFVSTGATITGGAGKDILVGGAGADTINGGAGDDSIEGGDGNDTINGGDGADSINSGTGNNKIYGSLGIDTINFAFNSGNDSLIFTALDQSAFLAGDTVNNFTVGTDKIDLTSMGLTGGAFAATVSGFGGTSAGQALQAGSVKAIFDVFTDTLYIDVNKSGSINTGDMAIQLAGLATFNAADLLF